jgi:hypothetical protein
VKKRFLVGMATAAVALSIVGSAGAQSGPVGLPSGPTGVKGIAQYNASGTKPSNLSPGINGHNSTPGAPIIGASWAGVSDSSVAPPDPNGAIGPSSYIEIINLQMAIYNRTGGLIQQKNLQTLTGHSQFSLSDPMILWDPQTQRFYYNVWDVSQATMAWGFSKGTNPQTIPTDWCNYTNSFGYAAGTYPDYPKLGQTKDFLLIGINFYPNLSILHATQSDVLWIKKPTQSTPFTTCPAQSTFPGGKFANLKNQDGTQAWTPVPAIQVDGSSNGFVVTSSDIECPDICGTGTKITVHAVRPNPSNPSVPQMLITGKSVTVPSFAPPATNAPQKNTTNTLSTLDGRLEHAVSAIDPTVGTTVIWTGHTVNSTGNRSEFRWYEIKPTPISTPTLVKSGTISSATLYVFNGAISPDRTCTLTQCAHGDAMVAGFNTSSSTQFVAAQMVSKIGSGATSAFVMVHQATTFDNDFTCSPNCRWGDYGGATPDPATSQSALHGDVWLTQDMTNGSNTTWNWQATP